MTRAKAFAAVIGLIGFLNVAAAQTLWQQQNGVWTGRCGNEPVLYCTVFSKSTEAEKPFSRAELTYAYVYNSKYNAGRAELYGDFNWQTTKIFFRPSGATNSHQLGCGKGSQDQRTCVLNINVGTMNYFDPNIIDAGPIEFMLIRDNVPIIFRFPLDGFTSTAKAMLQAAATYLR